MKNKLLDNTLDLSKMIKKYQIRLNYDEKRMLYL